jgi:thiol-disulfide isomerase/thioredoxin
VVLKFVASWCNACREELPALQALTETARAPIVFVAADEGGPADSMLIVAERAKLTAPLLYAPEAQAEQLERHYGYETLPATYLIDRQGRVRKVFEGRLEIKALLEEVDRVLPG